MEVEKIGRIGVLMGGPSSEREISLKSGKAVLEALKQIGVDVVPIVIETEGAEENIRLIKSERIDCAFLALHGRFGEDGQIQEILEEMRLPYTGSGVDASRLAMDKVASRRIFEDNGLNVPRYFEINKDSRANFLGSADKFTPPWVIKPVTHGSSIGLTITNVRENLEEAVDLAFSFDERVVIEEYISGREMTVGILDERPLCVIEIIPKNPYFDYEAKYQPGMTEYVVPAKIDDGIARKIRDAALKAHSLLGCFGCSRVDIMLREDVAYVLEVNTIPGLTSTSLLPKAAKLEGISFDKLCLKLINLAYEKTKNKISD